MKILITGGAGFIGSHLADRLSAREDQLLVLDNYATGRRSNLTPNRNLEIVEGDVADEILVREIFSRFQPEVVVHAAASYKDPNNWDQDIRTNVLGTANVVQACRLIGIKRLIYFQTSLCYGLHPKEQPITLGHPLQPEGSSYAVSKTAGEQYIRLSGLNYISFRLANIYGPRNLSGPLPTFYDRLTRQKPCFVMRTRRDFVFITDLIGLVLKAIDGEGAAGFYHVSSGLDYEIKELFDCAVEALEIRLEKEIEVRERSADDALTILLDVSKTNRDFGWKATVPLKDGVKEAIEWYKRSEIKETYTHLKPLEKR